MKKIVLLVLCFALLFSLVACGTKSPAETETDGKTEAGQKWDGTVASGFSAGDGTESSPYEISSGSQLAFLAKQVNDGESYSGKYFILTRDIDLAGLSWDPIGFESHPFSDTFDGKGHTVSHLTVDKARSYVQSSHFGYCYNGDAGLFGACLNAVLCNLSIRDASVRIAAGDAFNELYIGILAGRVNAETKCRLENIRITDAEIVTAQTEEKSEYKAMDLLSVGGVIGYLNVDGTTDARIGNMQAEVSVNCADWTKGNRSVGSIAGYIGNQYKLECSGLAGYLTVTFPAYSGICSAGAFGTVTSVEGQLTLTSVFSEVCTNRSGKNDVRPCHVNAIAGEFYPGSFKESSERILLESLFGYVRPTDETADFREPIFTLYEMPSYAEYTEMNCEGRTALPRLNGFDTAFWDLSVPEHPVLK